MRKKYILGAVVVIIVGMLAGIFTSLRPETKEQAPDNDPPAATVQKEEGLTQGHVAGANTTVAATPTISPPVRLVISDGRQTKVITYPYQPAQPDPHNPDVPSPEPTPENPPPSGPKPPEKITINLSGPLAYTLQPGQRTPILTYELTDGAKHQWFPGLSAGWQDSAKDPHAPVWAKVLERQSNQPYVNSYVHFMIEAGTAAKPGVHKVSVKLVLRPGIVLGVPVMVTVPNSPGRHSPQGAQST